MANYTVKHSLISASATPATVVTFSPQPRLDNTLSGTGAIYFVKDQVVTDTQLGGATPTNRLLALGAIQ